MKGPHNFLQFFSCLQNDGPLWVWSFYFQLSTTSPKSGQPFFLPFSEMYELYCHNFQRLTNIDISKPPVLLKRSSKGGAFCVLKRYPIPIRRLCNLKLAFVRIQVLQWLVGKIAEVYQQPLRENMYSKTEGCFINLPVSRVYSKTENAG